MINVAKRIIQDEMELLKNMSMAEPIGMYLIKCFDKDDSEELMKAIIEGNKKLEDCLSYIMNYAMKNVSSERNTVVIAFKDEVIYSKAVYYYLTEDISEDDLKSLSGICDAKGTHNIENIDAVKEQPTSESQKSIFDDLLGDDLDG